MQIHQTDAGVVCIVFHGAQVTMTLGILGQIRARFSNCVQQVDAVDIQTGWYEHVLRLGAQKITQNGWFMRKAMDYLLGAWF